MANGISALNSGNRIRCPALTDDHGALVTPAAPM